MSTMITSAAEAPRQASARPRAAAVLTRLPLVAVTGLLVTIAFRYLVAPAAAAAAAGIAFTSAAGMIVAQIGFGAFPLAFAALLLGCVVSPSRVRLGLRVALVLLVVVIAVRLLGMAQAHSTATARLLVPEGFLAALCLLGIRLEHPRPNA